MIKLNFSNGSEFMSWQNANCWQSSKYENESTTRNKASCKYAFDLDLDGVGSGEISIDSAEWIGHTNGTLHGDCNMKNVFFNPLKIDWEYQFQKRLF